MADDLSFVPGDEVLLAVEAHLLRHLGDSPARGKVTFVGAPRIEVLRFGLRDPQGAPEGRVVYATVGMSAEGMTDPTVLAPDPDSGPRAELVLTARGSADDVLRPLATLAAMPSVEGVVVTAGSSYDLGAPLVPGSRCTGVLVDDPGPDLPDLELEAVTEPVRFLPVIPVTPEELAFKRVHGPEALWAQWHREQTDLADLGRPSTHLQAPRGDS